MTIAREEIFGPVAGHSRLRNGGRSHQPSPTTHPYGLAAYVQGRDPVQLRSVARQLRAGQVNINGAGMDIMAPFGGYKQSGNGREWGDLAFGEFLETKAEIGYGAIAAE